MIAEILCDSPNHPIMPYLKQLILKRPQDFILRTHKSELKNAKFLFLVSCHSIITQDIRKNYQHCLVLHASDLPHGRGWSPHIHYILEGKNTLVLTLLEAEDKVDTGNIWVKQYITLEGHELYDEINHKLFETEITIIEYAVDKYLHITPVVQSGEATYYERRTPLSSYIDINKSLAEQFNLLRVCDSERFPAFFEYLGKKFTLKLEAIKE